MEVKAWSYKQDSLAAGLAFLMRSSAQRPLVGALRAFAAGSDRLNGTVNLASADCLKARWG